MNSSNCPYHKMSEKHHTKFKNMLLRLFFPLMGLASLIWMLIRIIPKPSRAEYPCMKVAAPIAGGFIAYIAGLAAVVFSFNKAKFYFQNPIMCSLPYWLPPVFLQEYLFFCSRILKRSPRSEKSQLIHYLYRPILQIIRLERQEVFSPAVLCG